MAFIPETEPITESDDELRAILADPGVELPPLLPALAHALGDLDRLIDGLELDPVNIFDEQGGWSPEQQQRCRDEALSALIALRDNPSDSPGPSDDALAAMLRWATGAPLAGSYIPMLTEELATDSRDLRSPSWHANQIAPGREFTVAIIGAGMSGILAAHRLNQAGVRAVILEKNAGIGGTWLENTYPGCRVDVSNHVYSYSFMQRHDWPQFHSTQEVLLDYFEQCADQFGITDQIRFGTEVTSVVWDDVDMAWTLELSTPDGDETLAANAVISAVGQLNRPSYPDIDGRESFEGPSFHSAQWDHDVSLSGLRVGIIGTGCSATQFIPHVAEAAASTVVFQRTPNWLMPRPQYQQELPESLLWLMTHVPHYSNWFRLRLFWRSHEGLLSRCEIDPSWDQPIEDSISESNQELRALLTMYLQAEFADRPELLTQVLPDFTVGAKRFVLDDGTWATTLKRDDVTLCTESIERISPAGIVTTDGIEHELDVIIYGTGFKASEFLTPMKVVGRGGLDLHDSWDGDARAYLGIVSPGFPNFFYMYGPNTNIVINGSIIYFSECEAHYITEYVRHLLDNEIDALDVRSSVHDTYNEWIDRGNLNMAWGVSNVSSWYKTNGGRVAQNWPYSLLEFWDQTRALDPADYEVV